MGAVPKRVNVRRAYDNSRRQDAAAETQRAVLGAAGSCFVEAGYGATTFATVARTADVSVETIKKTFGTKLELLTRWFDAQVAGTEGVAVAASSWVARLPELATLVERIDLAAGATAETHRRAAPALVVAAAAAHTDGAIAEWWTAERARRRRDVASITPLVIGDAPEARPADEVLDAVFGLTEAHLYVVFTDELGWSHDRYRRWLADALHHTITGPEEPGASR